MGVVSWYVWIGWIVFLLDIGGLVEGKGGVPLVRGCGGGERHSMGICRCCILLGGCTLRRGS